MNIITEYTGVRLDARELTIELAGAGIDWVIDIAAGAALSTQTHSKVTPESGCHDLMSNTPLAERTQKILETLGAPILPPRSRRLPVRCRRMTACPKSSVDEPGCAAQ